MADRFPWKKALTVSGLAATGLSALFIFGRKNEPAPIGRVALIGDSYAVGLGPELAKLLHDFKFYGRVGARTCSYGTAPSWLPEFKPRVVLVSLGVNDGNTPNLACYQAVVQALHGLSAQVVWIEPPTAVQTVSRAMIASLGVRVVPATTTPLAADNLHPRSYAPWAQEIAQVLRGS